MTSSIRLRDVSKEDLPLFFEQQLDPVANRMAAFTPRDPADRDAFTAHWAKILADETTVIRTIVFEGHVAGHVARFERFGKPEVTYWIGREYWGRGVATAALSEFLGELNERVLHARAAKDNLASVRVLEKCGFSIVGFEKAYANARGEEAEEVILTRTTTGVES